MDSTHSSFLQAPVLSRRQRFFAGYVWLVLKNLIGWALILFALVAGPLVPGPGGIPLFLIGFALVTFPGKRKLTAHVLRGRPVAFRGIAFVVIVTALCLLSPALALWLFGSRLPWLQPPHGGPIAWTGAYFLGVALTGLICLESLLLANLLLRAMPPIRRRVRPWLRKHRIHLLPPRRRRRHPHEHGIGPLRLKDEILGILKRPHRSTRQAE